MRALIVDDDQVALRVIRNILEEVGYEVETARNGREALKSLRGRGIKLLITDWEMPEMNGIEHCRAIRSEDFSGYVYIIMLTAKDGPEQKINGLYAGADNFIVKPINPAELLVCLNTADRILSLETRDLALFALAKLAESRDPETGSHIERVQSYSRLLAQQLSGLEKYKSVIDGNYLRLLYQTSPLHDIGKVGIPDQILLKPGKLDPEEFALMRTHTQLGAQTLDAALQRFPGAKFLVMAKDIAATHHEKYDGSGYPLGLVGENIPLCGRIVALADVYDALTSRRVYKEALPHQQAKELIVAVNGKHFDPDVVEAFLQIEEHFISIKDRLADGEADSGAPPAPLPIRPPATVEAKVNRILVVADSAGIESVLRKCEYEVIVAADATEARRHWAENAAHIVIATWSRQDTSNIELCRWCRANVDSGYAQFILVGDVLGKEQMDKAVDAGVDDFLRTPLVEHELLAKVRGSLRAISLHCELTQRNKGSQQLNAELSGLNQRLEKLAITDDLTSLFNRRHAMTRLEEQWALADRYTRPLTVGLIDIDHFKRVNDAHGHAAGDLVLQEVSRIIRENVRTTDTVCRVGGEEFLVIFPGQTREETVMGAERARAAIERYVFYHNGRAIKITISVGIAEKSVEMSEFSELLKEADQALYAAKQSGRNNLKIGNASTLDGKLPSPLTQRVNPPRSKAA